MTLHHVHDEASEGFYYVPTDNTYGNIEDCQEGYSSSIILAAQGQEEEQELSNLDLIQIDVVKASVTMIKTQVYSISTWHRVIHQDIHPMHLRPYLGW